MLKYIVFVFSLGLAYALIQAIRITSKNADEGAKAGSSPTDAISPQKLAAIAEPYRHYLGQMLTVQDDIHDSLKHAPEVLQRGLGDIDREVGTMLHSVVPQAEQATRLEAQLLRLDNDAQREEVQFRVDQLDSEMKEFLYRLEAVRTRVWRLLDEAKALSPENTAKKLDDKLLELDALEEAFQELRRD